MEFKSKQEVFDFLKNHLTEVLKGSDEEECLYADFEGRESVVECWDDEDIYYKSATKILAYYSYSNGTYNFIAEVDQNSNVRDSFDSFCYLALDLICPNWCQPEFSSGRINLYRDGTLEIKESVRICTYEERIHKV